MLALALALVTPPLLPVVFTLVIVGVVLYLVENYIPMSPPIKTLLRVVIVIFAILYLWRLFGSNVNL